MPPKRFLELFGEFGPNYLGHLNWGADFIEQVRLNQINGITFEGVVGKSEQKNKIIMYKAKTQQWLDKVREKFADKADEIINS